jgi:hypothetical protein
MCVVHHVDREASDVALDFGMEEFALPVGDAKWIFSGLGAKQAPNCAKKAQQNKRPDAFHEQGRPLRCPVRRSFSTETFGVHRDELSFVVFTT